MGLPNTSEEDRKDVESTFTELLEQFFQARGNSEERHRLVRMMRELRDALCVSWEQFKHWFKRVFSLVSEEEHQVAMRRVMPIYYYETCSSTSPFNMSKSVH